MVVIARLARTEAAHLAALVLHFLPNGHDLLAGCLDEDFARKHLAGTGTLPTNVLPNRWSKECAPLVAGPVAADGGSGRADDATASTESALAGSASVANIAGEWMTNFGQSYRGRKRLVDPPEGDGTPGQWTRWAGLG